MEARQPFSESLELTSEGLCLLANERSVLGFKLVGAIAGNHNFTPLSNQRSDFAEGLFVSLPVYFIQQPRAFVLCRCCNHCHLWPSVITSRLVC